MSETIFGGCVVLILYTYLGFPLVTWLRYRLRPRPHQQSDILPTVSVLIAAHNEEESIGEKVRNVLNLDYPTDLLRVIIASDGSTDCTVDILSACDDDRLTVLDLPRAGKAAALNSGIQHCHGEIVVFSDANSMFAHDAIRKIVRSFADPAVGGVAGDQRYSDSPSRSSTDEGERSYWNFDRRMKFWQSQSGNVTSATGAIYAIRRTLFQEIPEGVTDDFITSTSVIAQGYRLVFDVDAAAYEPVAADSGVEFGRKVRIMTRGLRGVMMRCKLLNPLRHGFYALQLFSHKVLRRQMVIPLIGLLICSLWLSRTSLFYGVAAIVQILFLVGATAGVLLNRIASRPRRLLSLPYYFCMVNLACLVATFRSVAGQRVVLWEPQRSDSDSTPRAAVSET